MALQKAIESTRRMLASLDQAQEAYRGLLERLPGPFWTLVHEQAPAESA